MKSTTLLAFVFFSTLSLSVQAAQQIDQEQAAQRQSVGVVSVSNQSGSLDDVVRALDSKATKAGASYFRIVSAGTPADSSHWRGSAEIYR